MSAGDGHQGDFQDGFLVAVLGAGAFEVEGVAGEGAAVGVEQAGLVEFPDLEAEGVLDGVAALLAEAVGPDVPVCDEVAGVVAEVGQGFGPFRPGRACGGRRGTGWPGRRGRCRRVRGCPGGLWRT